MDIGFYIADLLREKEEVSVPGLGTFMKVRVAGYFDEPGNCYIPPFYQVSFKNSFSDFSSIVNYISTQKNISASTAEYFIEKFSSQLSDLLSASGTAEIKPLGSIRKDNDTLSFQASESLHLPGSFFGLKPIPERKHKIFTVPEHRDAPAKKPAGEEIEQQIVIAPVEILAMADAADTELEFEDDHATGRSSYKLILAVLIPLLIISGVLFYYYNPTLHNAVENAKANMFPQKVNKEPLRSPPPVIIPADTIPDTTNALSDTNKQGQDSLTLNAQTPAGQQPSQSSEPATDNTGYTYEIIGAAFGKQSEADMYIERLAARGIEAKKVSNMPGRMIKVSLGTFDNESAARVELTRIHKDLNKEAWIARVKP